MTEKGFKREFAEIVEESDRMRQTGTPAQCPIFIRAATLYRARITVDARTQGSLDVMAECIRQARESLAPTWGLQ